MKDGDHVTVIDFLGAAREGIVMSIPSLESSHTLPSYVAVLPRCARGDHRACGKGIHTKHGWVAFLDNAIEGVHYAHGWDTNEAKALKAAAAL